LSKKCFLLKIREVTMKSKIFSKIILIFGLVLATTVYSGDRTPPPSTPVVGALSESLASARARFVCPPSPKSDPNFSVKTRAGGRKKAVPVRRGGFVGFGASLFGDYDGLADGLNLEDFVLPCMKGVPAASMSTLEMLGSMDFANFMKVAYQIKGPFEVHMNPFSSESVQRRNYRVESMKHEILRFRKFVESDDSNELLPPLFLAAMYGDFEVFVAMYGFLKSYNLLDLECQCPNFGGTSLMIAASKQYKDSREIGVGEYRTGYLNIMRFLLGDCVNVAFKHLLAGVADVDARCQRTGRTALAYACRAGSSHAVDCLLREGAADPNILDNGGSDYKIYRDGRFHDPTGDLAIPQRTPLMWAIDQGHFSTAGIMLSDPRISALICDSEGRSAMDYALRVKREDMPEKIASRYQSFLELLEEILSSHEQQSEDSDETPPSTPGNKRSRTPVESDSELDEGESPAKARRGDGKFVSFKLPGEEDWATPSLTPDRSAPAPASPEGSVKPQIKRKTVDECAGREKGCRLVRATKLHFGDDDE
jgi:hypothetical protein